MIEFFLVVVVFAHDWYPVECCGGSECRPVACWEIKHVENGWHYRGKLFRTVMPSPDGQCHACFSELQTPRCLFVPQESV